MKSAILTIALLGLLFAMRGKRNICNPFVAFNILWTVVVIFIIIGNEYVYIPSDIALKCILIGVLGFNLAQFMPKVVIGRSRFELFTSEQYKINYQFVYLLSFVVLILSAVSAIRAVLCSIYPH